MTVIVVSSGKIVWPSYSPGKFWVSEIFDLKEPGKPPQFFNSVNEAITWANSIKEIVSIPYFIVSSEEEYLDLRASEVNEACHKEWQVFMKERIDQSISIHSKR